MPTLDEICEDFDEWPDRWKFTDRDVEYGAKLLEIFRPFAEDVAAKLSKKVATNHLDNLWLLGGEVIRRVDLHNEHHIPAMELLLESVDAMGGPYCRHLDSEYAQESYDRTCAKLAKYLGSTGVKS